ASSAVLEGCSSQTVSASDLYHWRVFLLFADSDHFSTLGPGVGELREKAVQEIRVPRTEALHQKDMADGGLHVVRGYFRHPITLRDLQARGKWLLLLPG